MLQHVMHNTVTRAVYVVNTWLMDTQVHAHTVHPSGVLYITVESSGEVFYLHTPATWTQISYRSVIHTQHRCLDSEKSLKLLEFVCASIKAARTVKWHSYACGVCCMCNRYMTVILLNMKYQTQLSLKLHNAYYVH